MKYWGVGIFISQLYSLFLGVLLLGILAFLLRYLKNTNKSQVKKVDKSIYYRDIPCFKNIGIAYWLLYNFSDIEKSDLNNGLIGACLLHWYKKGHIEINKSKKRGLSKDNYEIDLKDGNWEKDCAETRIYNFLKKVAGNNNLLEKNEIRDYCSIDGNKFELKYLFINILEEIQKELEDKKYITVISSKDYIFFKTQPKITLSEQLIEEYQNLIGLKNFLEDYSNMEEKMHIEVHIWEDYLVFANLFGITNKVKEQFKKIYPKFNGINSIFEISLDNTFVGHVNVIYQSLKWQIIFSIIIFCIIVVPLFFGKR